MANFIRLKQIESGSALQSSAEIGSNFSQSVVNIIASNVVGTLPLGIISSSAQLPTGVVSGSSQVIAIFNANFTSGSTMATTVDTTFATDAELFITSSNLDAGEF